MESDIAWLIMGLLLITIELASGAFYLLMLGVAALAGSLMAYLGFTILTQSIIASFISIAGIMLINRWHKNRKYLPKDSNNINIGQAVVFECWTNENARLARVQYRGAGWEAQLTDDSPVQAGGILYIHGMEGNCLKVSSHR